MEIQKFGTRYFVNHRIVSAVKRVEFVSGTMSYIVLRGRWCNVIDLNVHEPRQEKSGDKKKDKFCEELEHLFDHFPKYFIKIVLGDFNVKLWIKDIFKPTIENESLHQDSNYNSVRIVNFATSKNLVVKSMKSPNRKIHKYT
jgi:hypothetical protein